MVVATCALMSSWSNQAFVAAPVLDVMRGRTAVANGGASLVPARPVATPGSSTVQTAGCAALLLAVGLQAIYAGSAKAAKKKSCRAMRVVTPCAAALPAAVAHYVAQVPMMLDLDTISVESPTVATSEPQPIAVPRCAPLVMQPCSSPAAAQPTEFASVWALGSASSVVRHSASRGLCARRVGASRFKSARRAAASGAQHASRASRRSVGAKLKAARAASVAVSPSFDSSRVRTKIQVGLRSKTTAGRVSARESETPATGAATANGRSLSFEVCGLALRMNLWRSK